MSARRTQTNEPLRCATLLPALAGLPGPLALIEVGASAGLTLLPDRYSYDYGGHRITGTDPQAPVLACEPIGPVPLPDRVPAARRDPPPVRRGDLLTGLAALAAQAPPEATLVIWHSAVLAYVSPAGRERFSQTVRQLPAVWLSNEGARILPEAPVPEHDGSCFVLTRDGRETLAFTDPHGAWLRWLAG